MSAPVRAWVHRLHDRRHQGDGYWDECRALGMDGKSLVMFRWTTPGGEVVAARYVARELWDGEADALVASLMGERQQPPTPSPEGESAPGEFESKCESNAPSVAAQRKTRRSG